MRLHGGTTLELCSAAWGGSSSNAGSSLLLSWQTWMQSILGRRGTLSMPSPMWDRYEIGPIVQNETVQRTAPKINCHQVFA